MFNFVTSATADAISVSWNDGDLLQAFEPQIASVMLSRGWAVEPTKAAIEWANDTFSATVVEMPISAPVKESLTTEIDPAPSDIEAQEPARPTHTAHHRKGRR